VRRLYSSQLARVLWLDETAPVQGEIVDFEVPIFVISLQKNCARRLSVHTWKFPGKSVARRPVKSLSA